MATRLPTSKYLKTDSVPAFDGCPQAMDGFDVSIQSMLELYNFPLYYGGTVRREPDGEYEYVGAANPEGVSNYILGKRLYAGLCGRLEKSALHWWQSYVRDSKAKPDCWHKHADCHDRVRGSVPHTIIEVSLYNLWHDHFSMDMNAQKAELELERFVCKPFGKDCMYVVVFKDHVERLLWCAGITGNTRTFQRICAIRNCLPPKFKEVVHMVKTEAQLWEAIEVAYSTSEVDYLKQCSSCGKIGHFSESCHSHKASDKPADEKHSQSLQCTHCKRKGHVENVCWSKHGRPGATKAEEATAGEAPKLATRNSVAGTTGTSRARTCFRCGKDWYIFTAFPMSCPPPALTSGPRIGNWVEIN